MFDILVAIIKLPFLKLQAWWSVRKAIKAGDKAIKAMDKLLEKVKAEKSERS